MAQGPRDEECSERSRGSGPFGGVAAAEPGGEDACERLQLSSSSRCDKSAGVEITYFSVAQLPRSIRRQRSLQKGISGLSKVTSFLQIGHFILEQFVIVFRLKFSACRLVRRSDRNRALR